MTRFFLSMILIFFICVGCNDNSLDPALNQYGKITIGISSANSLKKTTSDEDVKYAVFSVVNSSGQTVYESKKIEILKIGTTYTSNPIELQVGDYNLSKFMLLDKNDVVKYATPVENSQKADFVSNPLNIEFSIQQDEITNVTPEVVSADNSNPSDFGYLTFGFKIIKTFDILISPFTFDPNTSVMELTEADIEVKSDTSFAKIYKLNAATNTITIKDELDNYVISVAKNGYKPYQKSFTYEEIKNYTTTPLKVLLEKFDSATVLYLRSNGEHGSTVFEDLSIHNNQMTIIGTPIHSNQATPSGKTTMKFSGTEFMTIPDKPIFNMGYSGNVDDFSVDAWVNITQSGNFKVIVQKSNPGGGVSYGGWGLYINFDDRLRFSAGKKDINYSAIEGNTKLELNKWYHIAAVCKNGEVKLFVNGKLETLTFTHGSSFKNCDMSQPNTTFNICGFDGVVSGYPNPGNHFTGFINNIRVTKGESLWENDFTPPTNF